MQASFDKWQDPFIEKMRGVGDPVADAAIARVFDAGEIGRVNELLIALVRNDHIPRAGLDPIVYDYLEQTAATPVTNPALVAEAQKFFLAHGDLVLFSLVCSSLPECYTMKKGVNVLWMTQKLADHVLRRLLETAQLVLKVLSPGGLEPDGEGFVAAAKVRLMHAAIRRLILYGKPRPAPAPATIADVMINTSWDTAALGYPINQTDLAYTLLTFSHVIPRSMQRLGVTMTDQQKDAFVHCWNVVGLVMGIQPAMLPANYAEAEWLFSHIKEREGGASQPGQAMTGALVSCLKDAMPGHIADFLPLQLMRELIDPATCDWLGIPKPGFLSKIGQDLLVKQIRAAALVKREANEHLVVTPLVWNWAAGKLMNFLTNYQQPPGWNKAIFEIPDALASNWALARVDSK